jgi:hypothetical protein
MQHCSFSIAHEWLRELKRSARTRDVAQMKGVNGRVAMLGFFIRRDEAQTRIALHFLR